MLIFNGGYFFLVREEGLVVGIPKKRNRNVVKYLCSKCHKMKSYHNFRMQYRPDSCLEKICRACDTHYSYWKNAYRRGFKVSSGMVECLGYCGKKFKSSNGNRVCPTCAKKQSELYFIYV